MRRAVAQAAILMMAAACGSYPPTSCSWYVVVHVGPDMTGTNSKYLLCGNLFA